MQAHNQQTRQEAIRLFKIERLSYAAICEQLNVSRKTLRAWISRYELEGEKGLVTKYQKSGRPKEYLDSVVKKAIELKKEHISWGAPFIVLKLQDEFPGADLPSPRRLQQFFFKEQLQPKKDRQPKPNGNWAKKPFERVQVDAKECLKTKDGQSCCYLNFTDEYTGSDLDAFLFPLCQNI